MANQTSIISIGPDTASRHYAVASGLLRDGSLDRAAEELHKVIKLDSRHWMALSALAQVYADRRKYDRSVEYCQKCLDLNPKSSIGHRTLADCLMNLGETSQAIMEYQEAVRLNSNDAAAYHKLGKALAQENRTEEAITRLREAIQLDPYNTDARGDLGLALVAQGRLDDAQVCLEQSLYTGPFQGPARYGLGMLLKRKGDLDGAIRELQYAARLEPEDPRAKHALVDCFCSRARSLRKANRDDLEPVRAMYMEALEALPESARALHDLAMLEWRSGRLDAASDYLCRAIEADPARLATYFLLFRLRLRMGKPLAAARALFSGLFLRGLHPAREQAV